MTIKLIDLLPSWQIGLQAQRLSPDTIRHYTEGTKLFLRWCADNGTEPELSKVTVSAFLAHMLDRGAMPTTARARWSALKRFSWWLADEGHRPSDDLLGLAPPKLDTKVVHPLTDDELRDLIKVCQGKAFRERRDEALIRLLAETGMRSGECCSLAVDDVDIPRGLLVVQRGGLRITAPGEAREDGARGAAVHVLNRTSHQEVIGRVQDPSTVVVDF